MSGAERTRRYRKRRQQGIAMVAHVEVSREGLVALINSGRLDFTGENGGSHVRREDVNEAIAEILEDWAAAPRADVTRCDRAHPARRGKVYRMVTGLRVTAVHGVVAQNRA